MLKNNHTFCLCVKTQPRSALKKGYPSVQLYSEEYINRLLTLPHRGVIKPIIPQVVILPTLATTITTVKTTTPMTRNEIKPDKEKGREKSKERAKKTDAGNLSRQADGSKIREGHYIVNTSFIILGVLQSNGGPNNNTNFNKFALDTEVFDIRQKDVG